jgi:hypothetical protein
VRLRKRLRSRWHGRAYRLFPWVAFTTPLAIYELSPVVIDLEVGPKLRQTGPTPQRNKRFATLRIP